MPRIKMHEHAADIEIYLNKYKAEKNTLSLFSNIFLPSIFDDCFAKLWFIRVIHKFSLEWPD